MLFLLENQTSCLHDRSRKKKEDGPIQLNMYRMPSRALTGMILCAFFLCLIPLLYLARYDVPCADDYIYGTAAHLTLVHGGSLNDAIAAALEHTAVIYHTWQGSYSAVFLMCLQPAVFSEKLYFLTAWLMSASLFGGLFALGQCLVNNVFRLPRHVGAALSGMVGILYLLLVPYPSETLYWYNGAVYYTFFHGIAMLAVAQAISAARYGGALRIAGLSLMAAFLAGGNLVTGLALCMLALGGIILLLLQKDFTRAGRLLIPSLVLLICFCINVFAPGYDMRQIDVNHVPDAVSAVKESFCKGFYYLFSWFRLPVLGGMLILGLLFWAELPNCSFRFRFPGLVSLLSFCFLSALFCPSMYAQGWEGPGRLKNIIFCSYLVLLVLNVLYWLGWLRQHRKESRPSAELPLLPTLGALILCMILTLAAGRLRGGISLASAYTALSSGQAATYYAEALERLTVLKDPSIRVAKLKPYSDPPYLLFFDDLKDDPDAWQNRDMAKYYEKEKVILITQSKS